VENSTEKAVQRAIFTMRENLGEELTVDDLARAAMFSKFHFTRIFQRATGLSPGRFLSALRLHEAKQLLVSTSLNVADISIMVGYKSVGTFSSRFSRSVGMSPTVYRRMAGFAPTIATDPRAHRGALSQARLRGHVTWSMTESRGLAFVGLFPDRVPEGRPVRCAILSEAGSYDFDMVPSGSWYLLAQWVTGDPAAPVWPADRDAQQVCVATRGPLTVRHDTDARIDLRLKPAGDLDPPVLLALLDVRKLVLGARDDDMAVVAGARTPASSPAA
jgi:AraC-like DNA-binding protein